MNNRKLVQLIHWAYEYENNSKVRRLVNGVVILPLYSGNMMMISFFYLLDNQITMVNLMKLDGKVEHGERKNSLNFGADRDYNRSLVSVEDVSSKCRASHHY